MKTKLKKLPTFKNIQLETDINILLKIIADINYNMEMNDENKDGNYRDFFLLKMYLKDLKTERYFRRLFDFNVNRCKLDYPVEEIKCYWCRAFLTTSLSFYIWIVVMLIYSLTY